MASRTLIKGGTVITVDPAVGDFYPTGDVLIEDGEIKAVAASIDAGDAEVIDATDRLVLPGLVDTHRHTWQALFRNIASDWTLAHYFTGLHGTMSQLYRAQDTYAGNLIGILEALDSGITTLLDWSHNLNTPEHSDAAVDAAFESGARVVFGHGAGFAHWAPVSALDHPADDVRRLRNGRLSADDALVTLCLAPRGNQFATLDVTRRDYELAAELGIRISCHAGDGEWGKGRPIAQLHEHGLLAPNQTYVHCNSLADDELKMMADAGCTASCSPDIEMAMGHGWPATGRLLEAGIRPSLSIDVCSLNGGHLFGTMRATIGTERGFDNEQARDRGQASVDEMEITCRDVLEFATIEGARACGLDSQDRHAHARQARRRDPRPHRQLRHDAAEQPDRRVRLQRAPGPRRHRPRRRQGREAQRRAARRRRGARPPARGRVARRHPAPGRGTRRRPAGRRLDPRGVPGGRGGLARCRRRPIRAGTGAIDAEELAALHRRMLVIRGVEDRLQRLFLRGEVYGTTHLYSGQEAVAVGFASVLGEGDRVACTYRGHGHLLAMGADPEALLAELLGRATGINGGRSGSMNVVDPDHGVLGCYGIVGGSIAAATGAALSLRGTGSVAVAYFGDGATNQAYFFECLNFAQVLGLPARLRLREQRLRRVHAVRAGHRRRHRRPRGRVRAARDRGGRDGRLRGAGGRGVRRARASGRAAARRSSRRGRTASSATPAPTRARTAPTASSTAGASATRSRSPPGG